MRSLRAPMGCRSYVEEMTKAVLESGFLRETADAWHLDTPLAQLAIPTSLHNSLMARLDRSEARQGGGANRRGNRTRF